MHLQGFSVVADLLNVSDCKRTVEEAVKMMGGLDILVNCGGVWTDAITSDHLGAKGFGDAFTMHVVTPAQLIEEAMPHLSANKVCMKQRDPLHMTVLHLMNCRDVCTAAQHVSPPGR